MDPPPAASSRPTPRPSPSTSASPPTGCPTPSPSSPSTSNSSLPLSRPRPSQSARFSPGAGPASPPTSSGSPASPARRPPPAPPRQQRARALWDLPPAGLASADGFDQLRALMDPRRKPATADTAAKRPTRTTAGRWSLLVEPQNPGAPGSTVSSSTLGLKESQTQAAIAPARRTDAALESFARQLLARYGILFRDLLTRESNAPRWRDLLNILRRLEARGEVRGGRFVTGFGGEQFALPEAVESLRLARTRQ